jgi:hypothetical protein
MKRMALSRHRWDVDDPQLLFSPTRYNRSECSPLLSPRSSEKLIAQEM